MARAAVARNRTMVDLTLLGVSAGVALLATVLPTNVSAPVAAGFRRTLVAPLVALQARAERSREAFYAHEAVTARIDSIALRAAAANALQSENERLRRLLGLGGRVRWGFIVAEALHTTGPSEADVVTLTAGSASGVLPRSPVVAPEGIVGIVRDVDPTMSMAIVWSHRDFRVSAMTVDATAFGIVQPHVGSFGSNEYLELRNVPLRDTLAPNTLIVSSGSGSTFPRGIPVGTVIRQIDTPEKWARTYLLRPAVPIAQMHSVMVLRRDRIEAGVTEVWASAAKADSAARGIAAAADQVLRDSLAAARQRQLAIDSARARAAAAAAAAALPADSTGAPAMRPALPAAPRPAVPRPAPRPAPPTADSAAAPPRDSAAPGVPR